MSFKEESCQRRVFLVTYSQADRVKFPTTESFSNSLSKAFGGGGLIKEWACCEEPHENGGFHFHMAIILNKSRRWGPVKKSFSSENGVSLHFQEDNCGYVAAYRYVCKDKPISEVLHSPGHSNMTVLKSPKTKKAMRRWSISTQQNRSASNHPDENDDQQPGPSKKSKPMRLSNLEVSKVLISDKIKTESELMRLALHRSQNGEHDLQSFLLNKTPRAISDLINTTWKIHYSEDVVQRERKSRMVLIREAAQGQCVQNCQNKDWLKCAREILTNNEVNVFYFACAVRNALKKGRGKGNNLLIVGPTNCGKSFLLNPLELIFKTFINPANTKYAWIGLEDSEVAYLNDFRWNREMIEWSDFLLLLEGQTVHLPRPKNQYATDLAIDRKHSIPFFATSKSAIQYAGKFNAPDEKESDMMASRWQMFSFTFQIQNPRDLGECPRCFAELILTGSTED